MFSVTGVVLCCCNVLFDVFLKQLQDSQLAPVHQPRWVIISNSNSSNRTTAI